MKTRRKYPTPRAMEDQRYLLAYLLALVDTDDVVEAADRMTGFRLLVAEAGSTDEDLRERVWALVEASLGLSCFLAGRLIDQGVDVRALLQERALHLADAPTEENA